MGERAKLVGQALVALVLKGVGIHRIEAQLVACRLLAERIVVSHLVPWKMRRDVGRNARQLVDDATILKLVMNVAWFTGARKARKARATRAHAPGRHGNGEAHGTLGHRLDRDATPRELPAEGFVDAVMAGE